MGRMGDLEKGILFLRKAISLSDENYIDPYYDLAVLLAENGRTKEALEVINEGREKHKTFESISKMY